MGYESKKQPLFPAFLEEDFTKQPTPDAETVKFQNEDEELAATLGKSFATLRNFPDLPAGAVSRHALDIGFAGECHVNSWGARRGLRPVSAPPGMAFDQLYTVGQNLLRIQTKTTVGPAADGTYRFCLTHGNWRAPQGVGPYQTSDFDIAALVFLDLQVVFFTAEKAKTFTFSQADVRLINKLEAECFYDCLLILGLIIQSQFKLMTDIYGDPDLLI